MVYRRFPFAVPAVLLHRLRRVFFLPALIWCCAILASVQITAAAPYAGYVMDARNGEVLLSQNADARLHPASLTKMMTLYIAFQAIRDGQLSLDTMVTVSSHAANQAPSRLGLKRGQKIQMRYLIRAAAIKSANDAATAIGEQISGSEAEFAELMTRTAKSLGMTRSTFKNANGLTAAGHLSTAKDMSILGRHLFFDFPEFYNLFSRRSADAGVATVRTTNSRFLDNYDGADGIKTGYTSAAGFNLTASAKRGNKRIIATVFGGTSTAQRNAKVAELLDLGFRKAGNSVRTRPPKAPAFAGKIRNSAPTPAPAPDPDAALVAALVAEAQAAPALPAVPAPRKGLERSPRPKARPETLSIAAAQPETTPEATPEAPAEAAPVVPADDLMAAIQDSVDAALSDVAEDLETAAPQAVASAMPPRARPARPGSAAPAEEQPVVLAEAGVLTDLPEAEAVAAAEETAEPATELASAEPVLDAEPGLVMASSLRPLFRPERAAPAASAAPAVEVASAAETPAPRPAARDAGQFTPPPAAAPAAETLAVAVMEKADEAPVVELAAATPAPEAARAAARGIEPEVFAMAPAEPEVVTRLSTSGGRQWGVNVGLYGSEYEAERVLLTTALKESATLGKSLRKVARSPRGFQANFVGMTEDMAVLACSRLQARNIKCSTLSPG